MKLRKLSRNQKEKSMKIFNYSLVIVLTALIASALTLSLSQSTTTSTTPSINTIYKDIIKKVKVPVFIDKPNTNILKENQIIKLSKKYMSEAGHNLENYELRKITMKIGSNTYVYNAYFDSITEQLSVIYRLIEYSDSIPFDIVGSTLPSDSFYPIECFVKIDKTGELVNKIKCLRVE